MLDANGYPLPMSAVYGAWETVEEEQEAVREGGPETEVGGERDASVRRGEETSASRKRARDDGEEKAERADSGTVSQRDVPADGEAVEETGALFKKRSAPRSRRIRKKGRR